VQTIYYSLTDSIDKNRIFPFRERGCIVVLGLFDGVHIAHRELISVGKRLALEKGLPLVIFTFSADSPMLKPGTERIYTDKEKLSLLAQCGADFTVISDFESLRSTSGGDFAKKILIDGMNARHFVCGYNFRYGRNAEGDSESLLSTFLGESRCGTVVEEIKYKGEAVSSTRIREAIASNDMKEAAALLGLPYFICGRTGHGVGLGRQMGIPTVNIDLNADRSSPRRGVYASLVKLGGEVYPALTNVGTCPTFGERDVHTETFILDFEGDIYGEKITVYFIDYLRDEKKFSSEKELIMQIMIDKNNAIRILEDLKWQEIGQSLQ